MKMNKIICKIFGHNYNRWCNCEKSSHKIKVCPLCKEEMSQWRQENQLNKLWCEYCLLGFDRLTWRDSKLYGETEEKFISRWNKILE